jgi:acyl-CoA thioester hydrolase
MMTTAAAAGDRLKTMPLPPAPFLSSVMQLEPQWIDYNGHLNMAYYNVMMDRAIDEMWLQLGIGPAYMKERHASTFTAEAHVRYLREIHLGDPVQISVYLLGHDEKRLHTFEELRHATEGWLSATSENMTLHMDMKARKVAPFPPDIRAHPGGGGQACHRAAARGDWPQGCDAQEIAENSNAFRPAALPLAARRQPGRTGLAAAAACPAALPTP